VIEINPLQTLAQAVVKYKKIFAQTYEKKELLNSIYSFFPVVFKNSKASFLFLK
jgi:hypothetical protein